MAKKPIQIKKQGPTSLPKLNLPDPMELAKLAIHFDRGEYTGEAFDQAFKFFLQSAAFMSHVVERYKSVNSISAFNKFYRLYAGEEMLDRWVFNRAKCLSLVANNDGDDEVRCYLGKYANKKYTKILSQFKEWFDAGGMHWDCHIIKRKPEVSTWPNGKPGNTNYHLHFGPFANEHVEFGGKWYVPGRDGIPGSWKIPIKCLKSFVEWKRSRRRKRGKTMTETAGLKKSLD